MAELKPCPFCGSEAQIHYQPAYTENAVCIVCPVCKARSRFFLYDCTYQYYREEKDVFISKERATRDAVALWNGRADNG